MQASFSSNDNSTDSIGGSSLQRSGLAMSVGDTKSIVLALQALQDKIRKLEHDRNFHQEQCEKAHQSHEAYKLDVEAQLDAERSQHRSREQELQDLLARANAERSRLQATLEESKADLGSFRVELERMLDAERSQAKHREEELLSELDQIRSDLTEEKRQAERLNAALEHLKAEKEIISQTNRRLETTVRDLIAVNNNLMDSVKKGGASVLNSGTGSKAPTTTRSRAPHHSDPHSVNISTASTRRPTSAQRRPSSQRSSFMNPTHSSAQRDVRLGEIPARSSTPTRQPSPAHRSASRVRSLNTSAAIQPEQVQAIDEVYEELQNELRDLQRKYKEELQRAAEGDSSPEVTTSIINNLMGQINRKAEQIRIMRVTKNDLSAAAGLSPEDYRGSGGAKKHSSQGPRGIDKALQRGQLVSDLRTLLAKNSH